ncbi:nitroreductase family protein [Robbsia sp. Bb-Pol-6]|uniref:Nitroreductase family protein n=1 Tax=Robbsia betulipollinis TaxID=2981849 RepID=A0ABT3ZME7_9BURK|nr:nitroreductase family protein [Robbsia betulipollinis]MCY0387642.1 nitroreductase family protein [Robbsia betulipollinis]
MSENVRQSAYPVEPLFLERWSPRAFGPEPIPEEDLLTLFEAARWAPSAYNSQPWRFIYARRDTAAWPRLLGLLNEFNQGWAKNAAALVFILSNSVMRPPGSANDVPARSHSFDAGAAWASLALQATRLGWYTHGMTGVDFDRAFGELGVPAGFRVEAAVAIGRLGDKSQLPEMLQGRETPSMRQPLSDLVFEGRFGG